MKSYYYFMTKTFILLFLLISFIKGRVFSTPFRTNFHSICRKLKIIIIRWDKSDGHGEIGLLPWIGIDKSIIESRAGDIA